MTFLLLLSAFLRNCFLCWDCWYSDMTHALEAALLCSYRAGTDLGRESGFWLWTIDSRDHFNELIPHKAGIIVSSGNHTAASCDSLLEFENSALTDLATTAGQSHDLYKSKMWTLKCPKMTKIFSIEFQVSGIRIVIEWLSTVIAFFVFCFNF